MVIKTFVKMFWRAGMKKTFSFAGFLFVVVMCIRVYFLTPCDKTSKLFMVLKNPVKYIHYDQNQTIPYDKNMNIVFIGGMLRSGTMLMRAMIDAHPDVHCGQETLVIPKMFDLIVRLNHSATLRKRQLKANLGDDVVDSAIRSFVQEVIVKHGYYAPRLCNKDPFTLKHSIYLSRLFPNSKFLLLIRDRRAVAHSIVARKVSTVGLDITSYRKCLQTWNKVMKFMYGQCLRVGQYRCMPVYYEQLVLHPELWMRRILQFLDLSWNQSVLHHEEFIGKKGGISLSRTERPTDQVIKPVNLQALSKWVGSIPEDVVKEMAAIAPMLHMLGYDSEVNLSNYVPKNQGDSEIFNKPLQGRIQQLF